MGRRLPPSFLVLSPGRLSRGPAGSSEAAALARFPALAREALAGGAGGLLLREPALEDGAYLALARELRMLLDLESPGAWLGVHDRVHLAAAVQADGVQLAGHSLGAAATRELVGDGVAIGVSTHDGDGAARWAGADFVLHAPVFPPKSKHAGGVALGPGGLQAFCQACPLPVWALGGIGPEALAELVGTGAAGAAAIGAVWGPDGVSGGASPDCGVRGRVEALVAAGQPVFPVRAEARP